MTLCKIIYSAFHSHHFLPIQEQILVLTCWKGFVLVMNNFLKIKFPLTRLIFLVENLFHQSSGYSVQKSLSSESEPFKR